MKRYFEAIIECKCIVDVPSDSDDIKDSPVGLHAFEVEAHCKLDAEERALDKFHLSIPIACLEDFEVSIVSMKRLSLTSFLSTVDRSNQEKKK